MSFCLPVEGVSGWGEGSGLKELGREVVNLSLFLYRGTVQIVRNPHPHPHCQLERGRGGRREGRQHITSFVSDYYGLSLTCWGLTIFMT